MEASFKIWFNLVAEGKHDFKPNLHFNFSYSSPTGSVKHNRRCNSRISQANLHAVLNFVQSKNCSHNIIHFWKFSWFVGTVVQNELTKYAESIKTYLIREYAESKAHMVITL
jgi:hypothetical protein